MKMKVLLADDEPSALSSLKYVIETHCKCLEIVYCAQNGQDALEKATLLQPDIVITDIKMPLMDGIVLAEKLRSACPSTNSVIVSGYQDFEYAKSALRSGVVDYLLKPLDVEQLCLLLDKLYRNKVEEYYHERILLLSQYVSHGTPQAMNKSHLSRYLPFKGYTAALVRFSGLPSRFSSRKLSSWQDPAKKSHSLCNPLPWEDVWVIEGRDDLEYFVLRADIPQAPSLEIVVKKTLEIFSASRYSVVYSQDSFALENSHSTAKCMWRTMDNRLVLGITQTIVLSGKEVEQPKEIAPLDSVMEARFAYFITEGMYDELKNELIGIFNQWERERLPLKQVENYLQQVARILKQRISLSPGTHAEFDFLLDEAISYSTTFGELLENVWQIIGEITRNRTDKNVKVDTTAFFVLIEEHVQKNLKESLSLGSVCSHMGISQTYLSRLFRKYTHMSFNKYLTVKRIEEAKRLIDKNINIPVQDVALSVGYDTPSYFSKVFREVVGVSPSEYASGNKPS